MEICYFLIGFTQNQQRILFFLFFFFSSMGFFVFLISSAICANECSNLFSRRYNDFCSKDPEYAEKDTTERSYCSLYVPFHMPIGWYGYDNSMVAQYIFAETETTIAANGALTIYNSSPDNASSAETRGMHDMFNERCPMYDGSRSNLSSCCLHRSYTQFEGNDLSAIYLNLDQFYRRIQYRIYPKCFDLIQYMPCALCNPKTFEDNVTFITRNGTVTGFTNSFPVYTYRLCNGYAEKIYKHCRRAFYMSNEKQLIVPDGFSLDQFKDLVGVPEVHGLDSSKCLDVNDVNPYINPDDYE